MILKVWQCLSQVEKTKDKVTKASFLSVAHLLFYRDFNKHALNLFTYWKRNQHQLQQMNVETISRYVMFY